MTILTVFMGGGVESSVPLQPDMLHWYDELNRTPFLEHLERVPSGKTSMQLTKGLGDTNTDQTKVNDF